MNSKKNADCNAASKRLYSKRSKTVEIRLGKSVSFSVTYKIKLYYAVNFGVDVLYIINYDTLDAK